MDEEGSTVRCYSHKKVASRGLPFRGHEEKFGSIQNGNFNMLSVIIAEYDRFLHKHMKNFGNPHCKVLLSRNALMPLFSLQNSFRYQF